MNPLLKVLVLLGIITYTQAFSVGDLAHKLGLKHNNKQQNDKSFLNYNENPVKRLLTVGILTQPSSGSKQELLGHSQYIFEMGDIWMRSAGLNAVYIPYNVTDTDLYYLLDSINGVFFTGGGLDLYNYTTGEPHQYTKTAMKILNYSMTHSDNGDPFPLFGVCQGH